MAPLRIASMIQGRDASGPDRSRPAGPAPAPRGPGVVDAGSETDLGGDSSPTAGGSADARPDGAPIVSAASARPDLAGGRPFPRPMKGPLRPGHLDPVPEGWSVGPPDFVGLGSPKAGSTRWWTLLEQHPAFVHNRVREKELHHFAHFGLEGPGERDLEVYRSAFARPPGAICGEFTATYLTHPLALEWLHRAAPDTRCIALVRNPVDRAFSALNMFTHGRAKLFGLPPVKERALLSFHLFTEAMVGSAVARGLARAFELFGRERVLVLQFERCVAEPLAEYRRTLRFLGIDEDFVPPTLEARVNPQPRVLEGPDEEQRATIARWFERDVAELAELVEDLDLDLWADFAPR